MSVKNHRHEFTALWWHMGIYGPQNVHVHSCFDQDCDRAVVGPSRDCDGDRSTHHRETLGSGKDPMTWFDGETP